jgi:hypothetical protein
MSLIYTRFNDICPFRIRILLPAAIDIILIQMWHPAYSDIFIFSSLLPHIRGVARVHNIAMQCMTAKDRLRCMTDSSSA